MGHVARGWRRVRQRKGRHRGASCSADELGDAVEPLFVEGVDRAVAQELVCHEECGLRVQGSATCVGRETGRGQRRSGGAAILPHRWVQRGRLLLVPRRANGGVGGRRRRTTRWPADGSRLSNASGEGSPALSSSAQASAMEVTERRSTDRRKGSYNAPLPSAPNVGSRVPAKPLRFELWGAREVLSLLPIYALAR